LNDRRRALSVELLGGHVKIRQEGEAAHARLEMDGGVRLGQPENPTKSIF